MTNVKERHYDSVVTVANELEKFGLDVQWTSEKNVDIDILATLPNDDVIKIVVRTVSPESQYPYVIG